MKSPRSSKPAQATTSRGAGNEESLDGEQSAGFPRTSLTLYQRVVSNDPEVSRKALGEFFERYWYPMYALMRSRGEKHEDAADLVQGFIAEQLLEREQVNNWEPEKGRLRTFLKVALDRYRVSKHRKETAQKRGGDHTQTHVHMDFTWAQECFADAAVLDLNSPDKIYDRAWADSTVHRAIAMVVEDYKKRGKLEEFKLLGQNLSFRAGEGESVNYREIAELLGTTENTVKQKMSAYRQRFRSAVITVTAQTVGSLEVAEEIDFITEILLSPL